MAIIDSLKRLERAGSESSRVTAKLHEAAEQVANRICDIAPVGIDLPRDYRVKELRSNIGSERFLTTHAFIDEDSGESSHFWINGTGRYLHNDFSCPIPPQTRDGSMRFARDIAGGLLDEIAAMVEARNAVAAFSATALEAVKVV